MILVGPFQLKMCCDSVTFLRVTKYSSRKVGTHLVSAIPLGGLVISYTQDNVKGYDLLTRQKACNQNGI